MPREIVIGDIHGCYDELMALLNHIGVNEDDRIIAVGDILDRGPKSVDVYRFFKHRNNSVVLIGNHERKHLRGIHSYSQEIVKLQFKDQYQELLYFLSSLSYQYESENAIVVHAAVEPDLPLKQQKEEVLAGTTSGERILSAKYGAELWHSSYHWDKPVICGHHVVGIEPEIIKDRIFGIDTGCCHGMRLTAVVMPDFRIFSVPARKDYWKEEKSKWRLNILASKSRRGKRFESIKKEFERYQDHSQKDVRQYARQRLKWFEEKDKILVDLMRLLKSSKQNIIDQHGREKFNYIAQSKPYAMFLFLANKNMLTLEKMNQLIQTPQKLFTLAESLGYVLKDEL